MLPRIDISVFEDFEISIEDAIDLDTDSAASRLSEMIQEQVDGLYVSVTDVPDVPDVTDSDRALQHVNVADAIADFVERFVDLPGPDELAAFVVWLIHAHAIDYQDCTPRLALLSPEPGSGKTRALEVLELLVPNPYPMFDSSPAALFRLLGQGAESGLPTVLFDEVDNALSDKTNGSTSLVAILNSGYTRGKFTQRLKEHKGSWVNEQFEAFAPIALAGLHNLPPALASRSIVINMRPSLNRKAVERLRYKREREAAEALVDQIVNWVDSHKAHLGDDVDDMPDDLADRPSQIWEPLIKIGDLLGEDWGSRIRSASVNLSAQHSRIDTSEGVKLLADIQEVFGQDLKLATAELLERLRALDDSPWSDDALNLTARSLSGKLSKYGIRPSSIRLGDETAKGYRKSDFVDAWNRYLKDAVTSDTLVTSGTTSQAPQPCPNCGHLAWSA